MIKRLHVQNYKSIVDSSFEVKPFTLLIGPNASGKSNFYNLMSDLSNYVHDIESNKQLPPYLEKHFNHPNQRQNIIVENSAGETWEFHENGSPPHSIPELLRVKVFHINPQFVGLPEPIIARPTVQENGFGVVQVLDALKTGENEHLFHKVEKELQRYIPEIEKISFQLIGEKKMLQMREKDISVSIPARSLSEGTKLVTAILTILHQENPPSILCIEDIDRGLHPRLLEKIVNACFEMAHTYAHRTQIFATTHNPYLVDQFKDREECVIVVAKKNGETKFDSLADKLRTVERLREDPLGELWFSGLLESPHLFHSKS